MPAMSERVLTNGDPLELGVGAPRNTKGLTG